MSGPDRAGAEAVALAFLRRILPSSGHYVLARVRGKGFAHEVFDTPEALAKALIAYDTNGATVFHACGAYRERSVTSAPDKDGKTHEQVRVQRNVRALRSFYLDLDCGEGKDFPSQEAAIDKLVAFCQEAQLSIPIVVSSGGGIHCYWPLAHEVDIDEWRQTAAALKTLCAKLGLKADPACTSDPARVLRPVGTHNRKDPTKLRPVELIADAPDVEYEDFHRQVASALAARGAALPVVRPLHDPAKASINAQFSIQQQFPPCSAYKVADRCAQLRVMRDKKGDIPEPWWYTGIQLMCHAVEGDELIHEWSNGYAGYSRDETDRKISQVRAQGVGPSLCSNFEGRNPGGCEGCPFRGKISSPAQLGHPTLEVPLLRADCAPSEAPPSSGASTPAGFGEFKDTASNPVIEVLTELNEQYAWVDKQKQIFRFKHEDFIEPAQFKIALAKRPPVQLAVGNKDPKSIAVADAWLRWPQRRDHADIVYEPGKDAIFENSINIWPGWGCTPAPGDIAPWKDLLDEAFGRGEDRTWFEQWVAYPVQNPGTKLFAAVLLWGTAQGLGKSLIGQTIGRIYGRNYREIDNDALDRPFNAWARAKQFILGEELTSGDKRGVMNKLKHLITGETIALEEKYQPEIVLRNTINFMFTSNNPDALHIDINDRRIFVMEFAGKKLPREFFDRYLTWRDKQGGLRALMHHLLHLPLGAFHPAAEAPRTRAKEEMMDATFTDVERWIFDRYLDPGGTPPSEIVYAGDLVAQYLGQKGQHVTETAVGRALTRLGSKTKRRVTLPGGRRQLHAVRRQHHWLAADDRAWAEEYLRSRTPGAQVNAAIAQMSVGTVPQLLHS